MKVPISVTRFQYLYRAVKFSWQYSQRVSGKMIWLLLFYGLFINIHPVIEAFFVKLIIDTLTQVGSVDSGVVLTQAIWILVGYFIFDTINQFVFRHSLSINKVLQRKLVSTLEIDLAAKHASLPVKTIENSRFQDEYILVKRETGFHIYPAINSSISLLANLIAMMISAIVIMSFSWQYVVILFALLLPRLLVTKRAVSKIVQVSSRSAKHSRRWEIYLSYLESVKSSYEARILNVRDFVINRLKTIQMQTIGFLEKIEKDLLPWKVGFAILPMVGVFTISYLALRQVIEGFLTIGSWQLVVNTSTRMVHQFKGLVDSSGQLLESAVFIDRLESVLNKSPKQKVAVRKYKSNQVDSVEFSNVSFKYANSNELALQNISFKVESGENIGLVGHNGAGKTTLVKLLCKFYEPTDGQILINGVDLQEIENESYWKILSAVFQDFERYGMSARESIGYGDVKRISKLGEIQKAASLVGMDRFIKKLVRGYRAPLIRDLSGGVDLSTGQWQKMALARVLFRNSQMTVLDEPTSNMDPESEKEIFNTLVNTVQDQVVFLISHRFSTVRKADRIIVIDKGRLVEQGSHEQLVKKKTGLYSKLFKVQAEGYVE